MARLFPRQGVPLCGAAARRGDAGVVEEAGGRVQAAGEE